MAVKPTDRRGVLVLAIAAAFFGLYGAFSVQRHHRLETHGFDLGIFEQIVRGYAAGRAPTVDLKAPGFNGLGDHFHPILMLLAPLYRLFPAAETLLVAQAALLAASVIPVGLAAARLLPPAGTAAVTVAYGLSWGLQEAIGFDFHEICFAVPLIAASLERLLAERWLPAVAWAVPLVLVKEDLPLTVGAIGGYLMLRGQRRLGALVAAGGLLAAVVIIGIVLPSFNSNHTYLYADQFERATHGLGLDVKLGTLALLLVLSLFVALRSPLLLIALPALGWRFIADNPNYWGTAYHYSAVLMPIVFIAFLDGLRGVRCPMHLAAGCLVVALALAPTRPLSQMAAPGFWRIDPAVTATLDALRRIPDGVTVAATTDLAGQLTGRCRVRLLDHDPVDAEWVVADTSRPRFSTAAELADRLAGLRAAGYRDLPAPSPLVLMHRPTASRTPRPTGSRPEPSG